MEAKHPWQAKLGVGIAMLILAFIGIVVANVKATGGFDYWRWAVPIYAILALWLSWYVKRQTQTISPITIGQEFLHWIALIFAIYLISATVKIGNLSSYNAGICELTLLALAVFLAGVYIEKTFMLIGFVLGLFAFVAAFVLEYLYAFLIPLLIAGAIIAALTVWISHKKFTSK